MDKPPLVLSTTAFGHAAGCLQKYDYRWNQRLVPKPSEIKSVMRRGTWIHRCLELVDHGQGWMPELMRMAGWAQLHDVPDEQIDELQFEVIALVEDYLAYWQGHEEAPGPYTTVATEVALAWMPTPARGIKATLDRIVKDRRGKLWIWERKSTGEIPDATWRAVDPQTLIQYIVARANGYSVEGIVFDYVLTDPGPAMRVKKDGRLYAGLEDKSVTSRAFAAAEQEVRANWKSVDSKGKPIDTWPDVDAYLNSMRMRMVNDGKWFQRYSVYRPEDSIKETMHDVVEVMEHIRRAQETDHWPRSFNVMTCRRFCEYGRVCLQEYITGREAAMIREEFYMIETSESRAEGRSS